VRTRRWVLTARRDESWRMRTHAIPPTIGVSAPRKPSTSAKAEATFGSRDRNFYTENIGTSVPQNPDDRNFHTAQSDGTPSRKWIKQSKSDWWHPDESPNVDYSAPRFFLSQSDCKRRGKNNTNGYNTQQTITNKSLQLAFVATIGVIRLQLTCASQLVQLVKFAV